MELQEIMRALCQAQGPSGAEDAAMSAAEELLRPWVDEVKTDVMGNRIGSRRCGREKAPCVLLEAHMDQIGLIVTGYERGFLRFESVGGVDPRLLPALEVEILAPAGTLRGVVDVLPPHLLSQSEREKPIPTEKLFIDAGFDTEEEARAAVPQGTFCAFATPFFTMGEHQVCARSLDNRSCAAIVIHAMERLKELSLPVDLAVLLSAQEEVGGRGALTGAWAVHPDYAMILDVTFGKTPDVPAYKALYMKKGPAIGVGPGIARSVSDKLLALAEEKNIPCQIEVMARDTGTDADEIQTTREGVATGVLSLPLKYMHTPVEVIDLRDAQAVEELLLAWVESFGKED